MSTGRKSGGPKIRSWEAGGAGWLGRPDRDRGGRGRLGLYLLLLF